VSPEFVSPEFPEFVSPEFVQFSSVATALPVGFYGASGQRWESAAKGAIEFSVNRSFGKTGPIGEYLKNKVTAGAGKSIGGERCRNR
jgi:hypothetical protein